MQAAARAEMRAERIARMTHPRVRGAPVARDRDGQLGNQRGRRGARGYWSAEEYGKIEAAFAYGAHPMHGAAAFEVRVVLSAGRTIQGRADVSDDLRQFVIDTGPAKEIVEEEDVVSVDVVWT
jgi:hypothetical protein